MKRICFSNLQTQSMVDLLRELDAAGKSIDITETNEFGGPIQITVWDGGDDRVWTIDMDGQTSETPTGKQTFYVHKLEMFQLYGGPEEGGWWYDQQNPIPPSRDDYMEPIACATETEAYRTCRALNDSERVRREGLQHSYTSVLSHMETFYTYTVTESQTPERRPEDRPHYE